MSESTHSDDIAEWEYERRERWRMDLLEQEAEREASKERTSALDDVFRDFRSIFGGLQE